MKSTHEWQALAFPVPRLTWPLRSGFEKPILGCFGRERGADVQHALEHQHKRAFGLLARHLMSFHHAPGHVPCAHVYRRPAAAWTLLSSRSLLPVFPYWTGGCERPSQSEREDRYQAIPVRATRIGAADLTPRAHQVYLDLVRALKHGQ